MTRSSLTGALAAFAALACAFTLSPPASAQNIESTYNGHKIFIPQSSIPQPDRHHTNYFFVDSDKPSPNGPPAGVETPGSIACVYQLVSGPVGCPVKTATAVPTGGIGASAIVDAGDYPPAEGDLTLFSNSYGIPAADFTIEYSGPKPPVYGEWLTEEALDIEWAHAM